MKQPHVTRRQRNQALADEDAKNRCRWCKVSLLSVPKVIQYLGESEFYCSEGCRADRIAYQEQRKA